MTTLYGWLPSARAVIDFRTDNLWASADFIQIKLLLVLIAGNFCVYVWDTDGSVRKGVAEWRCLRGHEALKGRKLYRNRDSVDRNVCPSMSGLSVTSLYFIVTVRFDANLPIVLNTTTLQLLDDLRGLC